MSRLLLCVHARVSIYVPCLCVSLSVVCTHSEMCTLLYVCLVCACVCVSVCFFSFIALCLHHCPLSLPLHLAVHLYLLPFLAVRPPHPTAPLPTPPHLTRPRSTLPLTPPPFRTVRPWPRSETGASLSSATSRTHGTLRSRFSATVPVSRTTAEAAAAKLATFCLFGWLVG